MANGTCKVEGCSKTGRVILGWCEGHYTRWSRTGDVGSAYIKPARVKIPPGTACSVDGCDRPAHCRGWCRSHRSRWERHGDVQADVPIGPAVRSRRPKPASPKRVLAAHLECEAPRCTDPQYVKGHCVRHGARIKTYGSLTGGRFEHSDIIRAGRGLTAVERFWQRVSFDGPIPPARPELGPCWLWRLSHNDAGYGSTYLFPHVGTGVHRVAWHLAGYPLALGMELDHLCRNPGCLRVTHLEQVTKLENMLRGNGWSGRNRRKKHCSNGHPFNEANTVVNSQGHRRCRRCANDKAARHAAERALSREDRAVARAYRLAIQNDLCRYCGAAGKEVDHYFPIVKGGGAGWVNLGMACIACNRSKGARCGTWFSLRRRTKDCVELTKAQQQS